MNRICAFLFLLAALALLPHTPAGQNREQNLTVIQEEADRYRAMLEDSRYPSHLVRFNLACCLYELDSLSEAAGLLLTALPRLDGENRARALNLMGVIEASIRNYASSADYFKQAVKQQPDHEPYKRNYEIAAKLMRNQPPPAAPPPPSPQDQPDNEARFGMPKPTEHLGKQWTYEPMSDAQADALLEMMRQREEQYIQQLRKTVRKARQFSSRPQW